MSVNQSAAPADELLEAPAPLSILFNLPEKLQTIDVLRALICAHEAGRRHHAREIGAAALASIRLSSSRPS